MHQPHQQRTRRPNVVPALSIAISIAIYTAVGASQRGNFKCKDGKRILPASYENDDFCDCEDGSDETSTAACSHLASGPVFICSDLTAIPSSRVIDSVCDCCDGKDEENNKHVQCDDRCQDLVEERERRIAEMATLLRKGEEAKIRMKEASHAAMSVVTAQQDAARRTVQRLRELKDRIQTRYEKEAKIEHHELGLCAMSNTTFDCLLNEEETACPNDWTSLKKSPSQGGRRRSSSSFLSKISRGAVSLMNRIVNFHLPVHDRIAFHADRLERKDWGMRYKTGPMTVEDIINVDVPVPRRRNGGDGIVCQSMTVNDLLSSPIRKGSPIQMSVWDAGPYQCSSRAKVLLQMLTAVVRFPIRFAYDLVYHADRVWTETMGEVWDYPCNVYTNRVLKRPLMRAEATMLRVAMSMVNDAEREASFAQTRGVREDMNDVFGNDLEWFALSTQCFETKSDEYTYVLCPFNNATQRSEKKTSTSLGKWDRWVSHRVKSPLILPRRMRFVNGTKIWKGERRTTTVTFVCATENLIRSVDEPSIGSYEFLFETPLACDGTRLEGRARLGANGEL